MESSGSGGGLFDKLKDFFDVQSEPSDKMEQERLTAAQQLVEEYTRHLQSYLEEQDRWEDVRQAALDS